MSGGGSKKGERRGGRQKGTQNKFSADLKKAIDKAFESVGAASYLTKIAKEDPRTFCTLLGKILPTTVAHDHDCGIYGGICCDCQPRLSLKTRGGTLQIGEDGELRALNPN